MYPIIVYILGVTVGHVLLKMRVNSGVHVTSDENCRWFFRIWLWPLFLFIFWPVYYTACGIRWVFRKLGLAQMYADVGAAIAKG